MNTLKIKVLLVLTNITLWRHVRQAFSIWISTSLLASAFLWVTEIIGLRLSEIIIASLVFSAPTVALLVVILYFLSTIQVRMKRIAFAGTAILLTCAFVITAFLYIARHYPLSNIQLISLLCPYVISAEASCFLFARNLIFLKPKPVACIRSSSENNSLTAKS